MAVYFVYRSHYDTPILNHVRRFDDTRVLDWFRHHWIGLADEASYKYCDDVLGCKVYGFNTLLQEIDQSDLAAPATWGQLERCLQEYLYVEGQILFQKNAIQVLTDDDELQLAYYFFDDDYLKQNASKTAFLLQDWNLPESAEGKQSFDPSEPTVRLVPAGPSDGTTYCVFLGFYDGGNLTEYQYAWHIDGTRLPELAQYLVCTAPTARPDEGYWPLELLVLRSHVSASEPDLKGALESIESIDWLTISQRFDLKLAYGEVEIAHKNVQECVQALATADSHDPSKTKIQASEHVAQISLHVAQWHGTDVYHRWIIFDDLWASAHADLANSILRYANRWDVLS